MPWISVEMPTKARRRASLDEAYNILVLILASSGDLQTISAVLSR